METEWKHQIVSGTSGAWQTEPWAHGAFKCQSEIQTRFRFDKMTSVNSRLCRLCVKVLWWCVSGAEHRWRWVSSESFQVNWTPDRNRAQLSDRQTVPLDPLQSPSMFPLQREHRSVTSLTGPPRPHTSSAGGGADPRPGQNLPGSFSLIRSPRTGLVDTQTGSWVCNRNVKTRWRQDDERKSRRRPN